jgi:hypothetical protein
MITPKHGDAAFLFYPQMADMAQRTAAIVRKNLKKVPRFLQNGEV